MTITELKAVAYDTLAMIQKLEWDMRVINEAIAKKSETKKIEEQSNESTEWVEWETLEPTE